MQAKFYAAANAAVKHGTRLDAILWKCSVEKDGSAKVYEVCFK